MAQLLLQHTLDGLRAWARLHGPRPESCSIVIPACLEHAGWGKARSAAAAAAVQSRILPDCAEREAVRFCVSCMLSHHCWLLCDLQLRVPPGFRDSSMRGIQ